MQAKCVTLNATKGLLFVRVCVCMCARVCLYALSSAELPQLCSDFAQLCFNLQQLLRTEIK